MAEKVIRFPGITKLDFTVAQTLSFAAHANLTEVVVIGYDNDGEFYFTSSMADGPEALWLLEIAKRELLATTEITR